MEILEFGDTSKKKLIFIHGFQSMWYVWEKYIEYYKNDYHIIVPILPGHNPNKKEEFNSFDETAKELEDYCINKYGKNIYLIYGVSMGGVLATKLLRNKRLRINKVIFDGSPLVAYSDMLENMLIKFYTGITHKTQIRDKKTLKTAKKMIVPQGRMEEFLKIMDNMSDKTIENFIKEIRKNRISNDIDISNLEMHYHHGTKLNEMLAKKTAKYIKKWYPRANIVCFKGKGHCEGFSSKPENRIDILDQILS